MWRTVAPILTGDHDILPDPGACVRGDGEPADLLRPLDYPVTTICMRCRQPARCERWFRGTWAHI